MDSNSIIMIIALMFLVAISAYFSATETAFSTLNKIRLKNIAANGNKKAKLTLSLLENYDNLLSTILIGNNTINILSASLAAILFTKYFYDYGITISTIVMTITILIFGEVSPKSLAKENPESFAMFASPGIKIISTILTPLNFLFKLWRRLLSKVFKPKDLTAMTEEELITIVDEAEQGGSFDEHEGDLIRSAIEFNDISVNNILTPRVDVSSVDVTSSLIEIAQVFVSTGYSRLPVYENSIDSIIGIIHEKDFYNAINNKISDVRTFMNPPVCVTTHTKISKMLRILQQAQNHMAIVVDDFGGTLGIVTLEDIIEELVGDIWDEHDEVIELFQKQSENIYTISCNSKLEEICEKLNLNILTDETSPMTVSGWVIQELGKIPLIGDTFNYDNLKITVTKADTNRVTEIQMEILVLSPDFFKVS